MICRKSPERTIFFPMQSSFSKPNTSMLCTRSSIFSRSGQLIHDLDTQTPMVSLLIVPLTPPQICDPHIGKRLFD